MPADLADPSALTALPEPASDLFLDRPSFRCHSFLLSLQTQCCLPTMSLRGVLEIYIV